MPHATNTGTKHRQRSHRATHVDDPIDAEPAGMFDPPAPEPHAAGTEEGVHAAPDEAFTADRPDGDHGEQEASPPADPGLVEQPAPEQAEQGEQPPAPPAPAPEQASVEQSSVVPEEVRLGQVTGLLHRMPLGRVLAYADQFANKIEALKYTAPVQALQQRMRVTEGRCAPVYFTGDDAGELEHLLAGDDALAAAIAVDLLAVSVITVAPGDAGAVQSYLASQAGTGTTKSTEDDFVLQVNTYHDNHPASPA